MSDQPLAYIKQARSRDLSDRTIRENLRDNGWNDSQINDAMQQDLPVPVAPGKEPHHLKHKGSTTMWDAFEHILLFISMYVLAISFGVALSIFADYWVPAPADFSRDLDSVTRGFLRATLAALIVSYPLFSFFFLRISKRTKQNPIIRTLIARKILIYATLVVTFVIVIGNTIGLIFSFLDGNISLNFLLNFGIIVSISSMIFVYYLNQVREDRFST